MGMLQKIRQGPKVTIPFRARCLIYFQYATLALYNVLEEVLLRFAAFVKKSLRFIEPEATSSEVPPLPPLIGDFDAFWQRGFMNRIRGCWNRTITSTPGAWTTVIPRILAEDGTWCDGDTPVRCINMGSYNYLGFAESNGPCAAAVDAALAEISTCAPRALGGERECHRELERSVAEFVGKEDALVTCMGFATNSLLIPALVGEGDLVLSDSLNHASIVTGLRASMATVAIFEHDDWSGLEELIIQKLGEGQNGSRQPWRNILVVVEGIYSMEGEVVDLPKLVALRRRHKIALYVDEAHSIGCMGPRGGGVCDYYGISPDEVDVLMGTFTKSFAGVGGYVAASTSIIQRLRATAESLTLAEAMAPACAVQVIEAMHTIRHTEEGQRRLRQLRDNSLYFRERLTELGFRLYGTHDSPVVPLMLYVPSKIEAISNLLLERNIAVVVVGFPACSLTTSRVRFCLSAGHTRADLDYVIEHLYDVGKGLGLLYDRK